MQYLFTSFVLQHSGLLRDAEDPSSLLLFPHRRHSSYCIFIDLSGRSGLSFFLLLLYNFQRDCLLRFLGLYGFFYLFGLNIADQGLFLGDDGIIFSNPIVVLYAFTLQVTQKIFDPKLAVLLAICLKVDLLLSYLEIVLIVAAMNGADDLARRGLVIIDLQVLMNRQSV